MPNMLSPNEVYADPQKWLQVDHEVHQTLLPLMRKLYEDWDQRTSRVHCYRCETGNVKHAFSADTLKPMILGGHVEDEDGNIVMYWEVK